MKIFQSNGTNTNFMFDNLCDSHFVCNSNKFFTNLSIFYINRALINELPKFGGAIKMSLGMSRFLMTCWTHCFMNIIGSSGCCINNCVTNSYINILIIFNTIHKSN